MSQSSNPAATLSTERVFSFLPAQVFGAFEDAKKLATWWGPAGFTNTFSVFEFKPGGRWVYVMHGPNGADYQNDCIFRQIERDRKVVIEHVLEPWFTLTLTLTQRGKQTHLKWDQAFKSPEVAEKFRPMASTANEQNLDRLNAVLEAGG